MSQTAEDLIKEGKFDEALKQYPTNGRVHYEKGVEEFRKNDKKAAAEYFKKAADLGYHKKLTHHLLGDCYTSMGKKEEALKEFDKHLENPKAANAWETHKFKGYVLTSLQKTDEAIKSLSKAYELNKEGQGISGILGLLLEEKGQEAEAIKHYDIGISHDDFKSNYYKGRLLAKKKQHKEAIPILKNALDKTGTHGGGGVCLWIGKCYTALNDEKNATIYYEKGLSYKPGISIEYCNRAQLHNALGNKKEALEDIRKTKELLEKGRNDDNLSPSTIKFMTDSIHLILETEEEATRIEAAILALPEEVRRNHPEVVERITKLEQEKNKAQKGLISQLTVTESENAEATRYKQELEDVKDRFTQELQQLKQAVAQNSTRLDNVEVRVDKIEERLDDMKEELDNKLNDNLKVIETQLRKTDHSEEEIKKVKKYFGAFLGTFSAAFVTAQVVNSGKVQINSSSSLGSVLSVVASFAPMVGDTLSAGVKSIAQFLKAKEMKTTARKMMRLAPDPAILSQMLGETVKEIVENKDKRKQIINTTAEDLKKLTGTIFEKIAKFCKDIGQEADAYLYSDLYLTPAEKIAHEDANKLIALWLTSPDEAEDVIKVQFTKEVFTLLNKGKKEEIKNTPAPEAAKGGCRGGCCNLF